MPGAMDERSGLRRDTSINIRLSSTLRDLIDEAATALGKSRSEFMLESARQHAVDVLLDQRWFALDASALDALMAVLDKPPRPNAKLTELMIGKSPWEN